MDKQVLELLLNTPREEVAKAMKDAFGLEGIRNINELWNDFHAIPDRDTTKTGPAMHSSGSGADKAMHEYSNPAPQVGIAEQYKEFTEKNIEGWGKMHEAFKSFTEEVKTLMTKKAEEDEKEEEKKEEKETAKNLISSNIQSKSAMAIDKMWDILGELETAFSKAEECKAEEHDEKQDVDGLEEAREHIEKAEKELEAVESHEKKELAHQQAMKAQVFINLGWKALAKATGLSAYDLKGTGNQEDGAVPGDSTTDQSKHDMMKSAKAKAAYYSARAKSLGKLLGIKAEEEKKEEEKKEEHKEEAKSDNPTPAPDTQSKAEVEALRTELGASKAESAKALQFAKEAAERVDFLNKRMETVTGHAVPPMTTVTIKSDTAPALHERVDASIAAGDLTVENAGVARVLVDRYVAASKGFMRKDIVDLQLAQADPTVQKFFESTGVSA